jgi:elongation factor P
MPVQVSDLRPGQAIVYKDGIYVVTEWEFMKPGKGCAYVKVRVKNIETGRADDVTWQSTEKVDQAYIDRRDYEYLYRNGDLFTLMDPESYEQIEIPLEKMEPLLPFLKENNHVTVASHDGKVLSVVNQDFVELGVIEAEPGVKGDTARNVVKNCVVETGTSVKVPHFVEAGMKIRIDTRNGEYVGRV